MSDTRPGIRLLGKKGVTKMPHICSATQCSDQMVCTRCDRSWDVNELFPPVCPCSINERLGDEHPNTDKKHKVLVVVLLLLIIGAMFGLTFLLTAAGVP